MLTVTSEYGVSKMQVRQLPVLYHQLQAHSGSADVDQNDLTTRLCCIRFGAMHQLVRN